MHTIVKTFRPWALVAGRSGLLFLLHGVTKRAQSTVRQTVARLRRCSCAMRNGSIVNDSEALRRYAVTRSEASSPRHANVGERTSFLGSAVVHPESRHCDNVTFHQQIALSRKVSRLVHCLLGHSPSVPTMNGHSFEA